MNVRRGGLGRGLGALIPSAPPQERRPALVPGEHDVAHGQQSPDGQPASSRVEGLSAYFAEIALDSIVPNPRQPRSVFDEEALAELVHSVREVGLLQPIVVRPTAAGHFELVSLVARESRLVRALDAYLPDGERLDYVLIDCPPSLGLLTVNAMVAAEEVFIPIQCEYYALEGLGQLVRNVDLVKAHLNPRLHVSTILLTMYDARTRLAAQVADEVRSHFGERVLKTLIPRSVRVSEAPSYGQTVMTYDPGSTGALSYLEAARELARQAEPYGG